MNTQRKGYRDAAHTTEPVTRLGGILRTARAKAGLSQEEVGKQVGIAQSVWARYEKGFHLPALHRLPKIAQVLDIPIRELQEAAQEASVQLAKPDAAPRPHSVQEQMQSMMIEQARQIEALQAELAAIKKASRPSGGKRSPKKKAQ